MGRLVAELDRPSHGDVAEGHFLRLHPLSDGCHPRPIRTKRWSEKSIMVMRIDSCDCCRYRLCKKMAAIVQEMVAIPPKMFFSDKSLGKANAELMDELTGSEVVGEDVGCGRS